MKRRLEGKVAVVTGAGNGIGRGVAVRLADEGAFVAAFDIDQKGLDETCAGITRKGGACHAGLGDVTDEETVRKLFSEASARLGPVDILVNNVGGGFSGKIHDARVEDWDACVRLNLRSLFLCTREVASAMMERRRGRIISMSSGARNGTPWTAYYSGNAAYAASKAGVCGFTRHVALELAAYNITVNAVSPGPIRTERLEPFFAALESKDHSPLKLVPLGRLGEVDDIAAAVAYLASDEAGYVSGATIDVHGGR